MSTRSPMSSGNPASSTIMAPRLESPLPDAESLSWFCPTLPPIRVASTTNAIQPRMAVFRCVALQRPARAARFLGCKLLSPVWGSNTAQNTPSRAGPPWGGLQASSAGRFRGVRRGLSPGSGGLPARRRWGVLRPQVRQDREHAAVPGGARGELELAEDARHVALHHALAHPQAVGDRLVGLALGHPPEDLALARRELVERALGAAAVEHPRHHLR